MAYVTKRSDGRYEIRESRLTPAGPRCRTLASFRVLTDEVLDRAEHRASAPFDRARVSARARELGASAGRSLAAAQAGRELLVEMGRGARPGAAVEALLRRALGEREGDVPDSLPGAMEWLGAEPEQRGRALRDLLRLADALPRRERSWGFPRLSPVGADR